MTRDNEQEIRTERAQNIWTSFARGQEPIARAAQITAAPALAFDDIGGLATAKDEILTYACAVTNPDLYSKWGTFPPSGLLLIGSPGVGKSMLAEALATHSQTAYVRVSVPRLVIDMVHSIGKVGDFIQAWSQVLEEMPPLTLFFDELEFLQSKEFGGPRPDLPVGPIMDFLLELIDRAIASPDHLVLGATGYPDTLRHAFARRGRFERVVEVTPQFPDDVIASLTIEARKAEARAGRPLFEDIDWKHVVGLAREGAIGDWIRALHAVLRRKARSEVSGEAVDMVRTKDLDEEVARFSQAQRRISFGNGGNYV